MNRKHLQLAAGIALSGFFIWLAFYLGGVSWRELGNAILQTNWLIALAMVAITMVSFYWRTFRWRIIMMPVKDVPAHRLFNPLMIGFGFNNVLPARAGEVARPYALMKQEKIPFTAGLSTIVAERLVDILSLLVLLILMPYYVTLDPTVSRTITLAGSSYTIDAAWIEGKMPVMSALALVLSGVIISFLVRPVRELYIGIIRALPLVPLWLREKLVSIIETVAHGFKALGSLQAVAMIVLHSLVIWLSVAWSFQVMSWGFPGLELTFGEACAFLVITCVVISLPSSPGFFGVYEFGGMVGLIMMGVVPDTAEGATAAFAFTLVVHFLQWVPITFWGLWAASTLHISAADAEHAVEEATEQSPAPMPSSG